MTGVSAPHLTGIGQRFYRIWYVVAVSCLEKKANNSNTCPICATVIDQLVQPVNWTSALISYTSSQHCNVVIREFIKNNNYSFEFQSKWHPSGGVQLRGRRGGGEEDLRGAIGEEYGSVRVGMDYRTDWRMWLGDCGVQCMVVRSFLGLSWSSWVLQSLQSQSLQSLQSQR